jgi:hypothetical protein
MYKVGGIRLVGDPGLFIESRMMDRHHEHHTEPARKHGNFGNIGA